MPDKKFSEYACIEGSVHWDELTARKTPLYDRANDVRSPFVRDYTRILHCCAFRRLKHKTQVFFNIDNDHVCTRMEHVFHVESVSNTIASSLGLNTDLTKAIALGHDLGHAPFGHQGETVIKKLTERYAGQIFWHEKNGLHIVDKVELLEDDKKVSRNLDLTYAVRDGIVSHCGEVDENGLRPRDNLLDLELVQKPNEYPPATWEACVVKIADKIAYIGRDIEDADRLGFISDTNQVKLKQMARANDQDTINTTAIMHNLIVDICNESTPEKGICLSERFFSQLNDVKQFNTDSIYRHARLNPFKQYSELVIREIFHILFDQYDGKSTIANLQKQARHCPHLISSFTNWLSAYCELVFVEENFRDNKKDDLSLFDNEKIYGSLETKEVYAQAVLDYISGMTDRYAIEVFNELITI